MKKIAKFMLSTFSILFVSILIQVGFSNPIFAQKQVLRHVVLFKFKGNASAADIKTVEEAFMGLKKKIKAIKNIEWGLNNSPENLNQGFTHCFFISFANEKDREIYLPHPAHKAFGEVLKPYLEKVLVIDYWAGR
jgi:hypothetical protein